MALVLVVAAAAVLAVVAPAALRWNATIVASLAVVAAVVVLFLPRPTLVPRQ